ncbi:MAG: serine hydrolase domain-containing protein [Acidobacteriota bacterium]
MRRPINILWWFLATTPLAGGAESATTQQAVAEAQAAALTGPTDAAELASFLDGYFASKMSELHIPGAVVAVVKDGRAIQLRGYGLADIEKQVRVDPNLTVFRLGSVSKVVTATAVMQLVECGKLRLGDDVNNALHLFKLPDRFPQPVSLADLLKHTGGFDERHIGMHVRPAPEFVPLGEYLARRMPPRVMPPGDTIAYSDFGMSLAGYLVEEATGMPFATYVDRNIFRPLGMSSSSFEQPMPPPVMGRMAAGYAYKGGRNVPYAYDFAEVVPAAALQGTARDMVAFIIAHLEGGRFGEARILEESTVEEMHRRQVSHHPKLRGRAYGFSEWTERGQRAIFHDGGMPGFLARVFLVPEHHVGFFIAFNADQFTDAARLSPEFTTEFLKRYFPAPAPPSELKPPGDFAARAAPYAGYYRSLHMYSRRTLEKIISLDEQVVVSDGRDGTLTAFGSALVEVEPGLFRWREGASFVAFAEDAEGAVERMFIGTGAYEKLGWYETRPFQLGLAIAFLLCFVAAPIGAIFGGAGLGLSSGPQLPGVLAALLSLLNLVLIVGLPCVMTFMDRWEFMYGLPGVVVAMLCAPLAAAVVAAVLLALLVQAYRRSSGSRFARVWCTGLLVAEAAFLLWLNYWNLLGFKT